MHLKKQDLKTPKEEKKDNTSLLRYIPELVLRISKLMRKKEVGSAGANCYNGQTDKLKFRAALRLST